MSEVTGVDVVMRGLDAWAKGTRAAAVAAATEIAAMLETYAKGHHPWKPDTGQTDATTKGTVVDAQSDLIVIILSAGTEWSKFLELARAGKFAWLWPAVIENQERIRAILKKHLSEVSVKR